MKTLSRQGKSGSRAIAEVKYGNGSDGDLIHTNAGGWNVSTEAGNWTVSGDSLIFQRSVQLSSFTCESDATIVAGKDDSKGQVADAGTANFQHIQISGVGDIAGTLRSCWSNEQTHDTLAGRTSSGAGTVATANFDNRPSVTVSCGGGSAPGGGDGTNAGGTAFRMRRHENTTGLSINYNGKVNLAGTTTAGANASNTFVKAADLAPTHEDLIQWFMGGTGPQGGSGSLFNAGGANQGGDGGYSGFGGGVLKITCRYLTVQATGDINCDGQDGGDGGDGVAQNAAGDIAGGGGGGAGGGGGTLVVLYETLTNNGNISVDAGAGGTGGLGDKHSTGTEYPGGNGGLGQVGVMLIKAA